jgi:hypothetical protein
VSDELAAGTAAEACDDDGVSDAGNARDGRDGRDEDGSAAELDGDLPSAPLILGGRARAGQA